MLSFLKEVALKCIAHDGGSLNHETLYIVPSKRSGNSLKKQFAELADKPAFLPLVLSIEQFIEEIAQLRYASDTELLFELYVSYKQSKVKQKDSFNDFAKWAVILLQDFNEIDRHLIDSNNLFSYLSEVKRLKEWGPNLSPSTMVSNYLKFWQELDFIYADFQKRLLDKNCGYQGLVYRKAFERIAQYLNRSKHKKYVFIGFNALNRAESEIIQFLLGQAKTEIYWDIDSYFLNDPVHSVSMFIRNYHSEWQALRGKSLLGVSTNYLAEKKIEIFGLPKNISQAKFAGTWLKDHYNPKEKSALVLSDESLLEPILNALPEAVTEPNITMGKPLKETTAHFLFENYFKLHINKVDKGFHYRDLVEFLSNPYITQLQSEDTRDLLSQLKNDIKQNNWVYVGIGKFRNFDALPGLFSKQLLNTALANPKEFIAGMVRLITELETVFTAKKQFRDLQVLFSFKKVFNELQELLDNYDFINDLRALETIYNNLIAKETLDYQGNPHVGLQVMGMLESRNLDFDTVLLTSVNEGILPSGKSNNSFIPYDVKKEFVMPTYREKDAVYAYHFYRLLQRAKKVVILYNTEPDVLEGGEKSRFITQMLTDENINKYITHKIGSPKINPSLKVPFSVQKTPRLIDELKDLAESGFSPSSLSDYIRDPKTFYKRYVLKIEEVQEVEESMAHKTFGTVVHDALEDLYAPFVGRSLSADGLLKSKAKIKTTIARSFEKNLPGTDYKNGKNLIVFNVIAKYLENFLDAEIDMLKTHDIKLLALEKKLSCDIAIDELNFPITLKGKLDRVDEIDGQLRIIDYKTGKVEKSDLALNDWEDLNTNEKYNKAFQLLCYAEMFSRTMGIEPLQAGIVPIKKTKPSIILFSKKGDKGSLIDAGVLADFKLQLSKLILELFDPKVPFIEKVE